MRINLMVTGHLKEEYLKTASDKLRSSLLKKSGIEEFTITEFKDLPISDRPSEKEEENIRNSESQRVIDLIRPDDYVVCLDLQGKKGDESYFSSLIRRAEDSYKNRIVLVIGGSLGISDELRKKARDLITMSGLTYPHQLFRIALMEALYLYL